MAAGDPSLSIAGQTVAGRYRVASVVTSDEKGTLWLARDDREGREVLLRVPDARFLARPGFVDRLHDAAEDAATPGVARVLEVVDHEGTPVVVVERVAGGSLADRFRIRAGGATLADVLAWLPDVAAALDARHKAGGIHGGVRPEGILFDAQGKAVLADDALVRALGRADAGEALVGVPAAAKPYVAPEAGGVSPLGPAFDQYGLAAVVYDALAGAPPAGAEPPPLRSVAPGTHESVSAVVARALGKDPSRRYPTASDFAAALRTATSASVSSAAPKDPSAREHTTSRRPGEADVDSTKTRRLGGTADRRALGPATGGRRPSKKKKIFLVLGILLLVGVGGVVAMTALEPAPPPKVTVTDPPDGTVVMTPEVVVIGRVSALGVGHQVRVDDVAVPVIDNKFERSVPLRTEGRQSIVVTVGVPGQPPVGRREIAVTYKAAWRPILEDAKKHATAGQWEAARAKLDEAKEKGLPEPEVPASIREGITKWEAPPELAMTSPEDGATFTEPRVVVKGTFASNRPGDEVHVDGKPVEVVDGRFTATVEGLESGKAREIVVAVVDRGTVRRRTSATVTYQKPPEVWEAFLKGWATPEGDAVDPTTKFPQRVRREKDGGVMALIPAGTFRMGRVPKAKQFLKSEQPPHDVTLSKAYYMDVAEVTIGQWKKYVAEGLGAMPNLSVLGSKDDVPVYHVDHDEASAYARWTGGALPTEAQWERAAKGGHDDYVYPWGLDDDPKKRNSAGITDDYERLAPVKQFPANDYGLHDMAGNVWEWCSDWYDEGYYVASPPVDPPGPGDGTEHAARGGGWDKEGFLFRCSYRLGFPTSARHTHLGFRCVKVLP